MMRLSRLNPKIQTGLVIYDIAGAKFSNLRGTTTDVTSRQRARRLLATPKLSKGSKVSGLQCYALDVFAKGSTTLHDNKHVCLSSGKDSMEWATAHCDLEGFPYLCFFVPVCASVNTTRGSSFVVDIGTIVAFETKSIKHLLDSDVPHVAKGQKLLCEIRAWKRVDGRLVRS